MLDNLSEDDISAALDDLTSLLGVREEVEVQPLLSRLAGKDAQDCVQELANILGLPVSIVLSYVPDDFKPGNANGFRTTSLSRSNKDGHAEAITAQVTMPTNLPLYGTDALKGFPIQVKVSKNCLQRLETFLAIMAHEMSHVLLASLFYNKKDSELHTDLVPIIFGLGELVERGRTVIRRTRSGDVVTIKETKYGYFTDVQFNFACRYVAGMVRGHESNKSRLLKLIATSHKRKGQVKRLLAQFRNSLAYVDAHLTKKTKQEDSRQLVRFHGGDYTAEWEKECEATAKITKNANDYVHNLHHYTSVTAQDVKGFCDKLLIHSAQLDKVCREITTDLRVLRKYVPILFSLRSRFGAVPSTDQRHQGNGA